MLASFRYSILSLFLLTAAALTPELSAQTTIVWQQSINFSTFSEWGPSQRSQSGNVNAEIADDFDVVGTITRIDVNGGGVGSRDAAFAGVYVDFRISLGSSFPASGRHFVSVQVLSSNPWYWNSADDGAPRNTALFYRNPSGGQPNWTHTIQNVGTANSDAAFTLYGTRTLSAPSIASLSATTLAQAGRLKISGSGFGAQQGTGVVRIGGVLAPISNWSDTSITAYVSDNSAVGADGVQVVTSGGASNTQTLQVTARPAVAGHVKWRFMADGLYIIGRPAVGADGTVYAADVNGHLYALTPAGGVKWIFNAGPADVTQPVSVGPDGTIYFANISLVYAINPDGTLKWNYYSQARVFAGPTVGPDGNIYAANDDVGQPNGRGAFVLSPSGTLLSNLRGFATRFGYSGIEAVFGLQNHWYFTNNAAGAAAPAGSLWAFALPNTGVLWHQGAEGQPRVQPSGNIVVGDGNHVHPGLQAFDQSGALLWRSLGEGTGNLVPGVDAQSDSDVGSDGAAYVGTLTFGTGRHLTSLNPNGTLRWQFRDDGIASAPGVSPINTIVLYSAYDIGAPSHVNVLTTAGQLRWREDLPAENGGFVRAMSRPRFSTDGATVYLGMDVNDGAADPYSYLYAFLTGDSAAPLTPTSVVSRKTHGSAGTFDVNLPLTGTSGIECRSGGASNAHTIVFTFPNTLTSVGSATVSSGTATISSRAIGADAHQYIVNLAGVTNAQTITVNLTNVTDSAGANNPTVPVSMGVLNGDTNGDGIVNAGDALQTRNRSGQVTDATNFRSDVNTDGLVNSGDSVIVRARSGTALP